MTLDMAIMKTHLSSVAAIVAITLLSSFSFSNQPRLAELNQLDSSQTQRQQQYQQAQEKALQPQADIRLDTTSHEQLSLSNSEMPCYPIHQITLVDYAASAPLPKSQFQWALDSASADLKLTLPHCFGGEGLGILRRKGHF